MNLPCPTADPGEEAISNSADIERDDDSGQHKNKEQSGGQGSVYLGRGLGGGSDRRGDGIEDRIGDGIAARIGCGSRYGGGRVVVRFVRLVLLGDEAVSLAGDGLHEPWLVGIVA